MGHLSRYTSPAVQAMMAENSNGNGESYDKSVPDIHCYDLPQKGLNARRVNCIERLQSGKVPLSCRKCEQAKIIAEEEGFGLQVAKCFCGRDTEQGFQSCSKCRARGNKFREKRVSTKAGREDYNKKRRDKYKQDKLYGEKLIAELKEKCDETKTKNTRHS